MAKAAKKQTFPTPEQIATFYAGGNMVGNITYDWTNSMGTTGAAGSGNIRLNPSLMASRDAFLKGIRSKKYQERRSALVLGMPFLSTLIHEAIHNRDFAKGMPGSTEFFTPYLDSEDTNPNTGFRGAGNEIQAHDLGVRLVPDALQRFFGIKMDSRLGKEAVDMVLRQLRPPGG